MAIAPIAAACQSRQRSSSALGDPGLTATALFPAGVSSGISRRTRFVRDAGILGTRGGTAHQPLRAHLQFLCFNDGYHAEHHADPTIHWTMLPHRIEIGAATSQWPPLMRWLDIRPLEALEYVVLRSPWLQRFVLRSHRRAFQALLPQLRPIRRATIVGGGLFPRTALILRELLPAAHLTIVDSNARNLKTARAFLSGNIEYRNERYVPGESRDCDLTVIPLCLDGRSRGDLSPSPSAAVLVHDWIWRRRGTGAIVSALLLKRLNLVRQ